MRKNIILIGFAMVLSIAFGGLSGYFVSRSMISAQGPDNKPLNTNDAAASSTDLKGELQTDILSAVDVVKICNNSVVNVEVETIVKGYTGGSEYSKTEKNYGTGVIIKEEGYIVTCYHVVEDADKITIITHDDTRYVAEMVGHDVQFDLAVVRIKADSLEVATIGDSGMLQAGENAVIIGNPLGEFGSSVSVGVISSTEREVTVGGEPLRLIQTDAAVNPGNSGGGMFNMQGQLIGIVNAKMSATGIEGLGFAIPMNTIQSTIDAFISNEKNEKAVLGVSTKAAICYVDGEQKECVEIVSIREKSAAAQSDLRVGDCIITANAKNITSNGDLTILIKYSKPGDTIEFSVWRDNNLINIPIILGSSSGDNSVS